MTTTVGWLRRQLPGVIAVVLVVAAFTVARLPTSSAAEVDRLAQGYRFAPMSVAMPSGFPQQEIRKVNREYKDIDAWISSVGAAVALNDVDGDGLPNDLCVTDPRIDKVVVTPAPGAGSGRYAAFALDPAPLPMNPYIAPMGCLPGDFNEDGRIDLMVYYWGRTPILFLTKADATGLAEDTFKPVELVPGGAPGTAYRGPQWNTNAVAYADFDGDGHDDILITNYFPHSPVLNDQLDGGVEMNRSMSAATNGGEDYFFLCEGATSGSNPTAKFRMVEDALPVEVSRGWELSAAANDLDGDGLPELYLGNDFGPDRMLYNQSIPGRLQFKLVEDSRSPVVPKSKQVGLDSFKGMGVDFGDLDGDGMYDMFVSNITTSWGIEESNFHYLSAAADRAQLRDRFAEGDAPFDEQSGVLGTAWSGWGWDVKLADFNNSGQLAITQANGFVKGEVNRWPQLQELATANDTLLDSPYFWPNVTKGDDLAGNQRLHMFVKTGDGRYADIAGKLGLDVPVPTRGIATGDVDGDGKLDLAVARQWDQPVFYCNLTEDAGAYLALKLTHDTPAGAGAFPAPGSPVVGAQVTVTTPDGRTLLGRVDGGGGHSGKRSQDVHIGLGKGVTGPLQVHLQWRDRSGELREQNLRMEPGKHELRLGTQAKEK
ncbi:hypothetical protein JOD54_004725 [Actinokineospora baliensis]|uniref:CRTAC1 family protein n=1 Tax=Actinokineospora baliensis TaxID=547056 RepID=UPI001958B7B0|nr:CRTAC1 family protein [Actinokineospora baliensis]MBM7774521.1 hypothetical protein [Actinokineospora baliensis]